MRLILVRHAAPVIPSSGGPAELIRPLTDAGLRAAAELAPRLAALHPGVVVSSPYLRAVQTVRPAALELGLRVHLRLALREWDSGFEPGPDYARHHTESWADPALARAGGESLTQLTERAAGALRPLLTGPDVVVGSHGTFLSRALVGFGFSVDWSFVRAMPVPAVYVLEFADPASPPVVSGPGFPA
jgi:2,3-bisphosphoglycerate-dependent phosphoglycerate mutase